MATCPRLLYNQKHIRNRCHPGLYIPLVIQAHSHALIGSFSLYRLYIPLVIQLHTHRIT